MATIIGYSLKCRKSEKIIQQKHKNSVLIVLVELWLGRREARVLRQFIILVEVGDTARTQCLLPVHDGPSVLPDGQNSWDAAS